ncbi:MAG: sulfotransferase-like domain-containing protein [Planctomycetota bacterium]
MDPTHRICLWSGPRNVSTALMYSFAQRPDTRVVDEPLYAHYLERTGAPHPGREEVLAAQESDGRRVVSDVILGPCDRPVLFLKQMAHHLVDLDRAFLERTENVLLVRDPREMLPSLVQNVPDPTLRDTGLEMQAALLDELRALGREPPVLDARELLLDPEGVLERLCATLGLEFSPEMLAWEPGPRPEDGAHWYANVHVSRGFVPYRPKTEPFPERLEPLLAASRPCYERLRALAVEARQ